MTTAASGTRAHDRPTTGSIRFSHAKLAVNNHSTIRLQTCRDASQGAVAGGYLGCSFPESSRLPQQSRTFSSPDAGHVNSLQYAFGHSSRANSRLYLPMLGVEWTNPLESCMPVGLLQRLGSCRASSQGLGNLCRSGAARFPRGAEAAAHGPRQWNGGDRRLSVHFGRDRGFLPELDCPRNRWKSVDCHACCTMRLGTVHRLTSFNLGKKGRGQ